MTIKSLILKGLNEHIHGIFCTKYNSRQFDMLFNGFRIEVTLGFLYPVKSLAVTFFSKSPPFLWLFSIIFLNQCFYSEEKIKRKNKYFRQSHINTAAATAAKSLQSCLTLCDPIDSSPPGSPVPGILQARTRVGCHFLLQCVKVKSESEVTQSCPTLCDPMDCSPPGSSVHGIFQARVLEWGAIAFSTY